MSGLEPSQGVSPTPGNIVLPPGYDRRSGLHVAAEAHAAGAVEPPEEHQVFAIGIAFSYTGSKSGAAYVTKYIEERLIDCVGVGLVTSSISEPT